MRDLEARRRRAVRTMVLIGVPGGALAAALALGFALGGAGRSLLLFGAVGVMGLTFLFASIPIDRVAREVKRALLHPAVEALGFRHAEKDFAPPGFDTLNRFGLLGGHERARFEDLIEGEADGKPFALCEAHLTKQVRTRNGTRTVTVFRGLIGRIEHPARVLGETVLARGGVFAGLAAPRGMQRAGLVDAGFERIFSLWTTDQVEARYLVTPDVMQRLLDLETSFHGRRLRAAFSGGGLYFALEGKNMFEAGSVLTPLDDPARMKRLIEELASVRALVLSLRHLRGGAAHRSD